MRVSKASSPLPESRLPSVARAHRTALFTAAMESPETQRLQRQTTREPRSAVMRLADAAGGAEGLPTNARPYLWRRAVGSKGSGLRD